MQRRRLFSYSASLFRWVFIILVLIPYSLIAILVGLINRDSGYWIFRKWMKFVLQIFKVKIVVDYGPAETQNLNGCVFILLNQTSLLDGPIAIYACPQPCKSIANIEFALIPFYGWWAFVFCWIIVRQIPTQAKRVLKKAVSFLKKGGNILISIEGRRSADGTLSPYKKGPAVLAINAQAKIVPIVIYGAKGCMGFRRSYDHEQIVVMKLLSPISTAGLKYEDRGPLVSELFEIGQRAINYY